MENRYKKPNRFIYIFYKYISKLISKFKLNLKVERNELKGKKGSFVVLANHESVIDFVTLSGNIPTSHFVISQSFYNTLPIKKLMSSVGVIPKQQFQTSITDLKRIKEVVDNNMPLAIYPAGLMSEQGLTTPIPSSTGKFVKWLNQDVYIAKVKGTYLSKPKWSLKWRKGKTTLEIYKLLSKEELENKSDEETFSLIISELFFDAYKNQEISMIKFKNGDNIVGLESVLYKCPKCGKEFSMYSANNNMLICKECGNSCVADCYGFLNKRTEQDVIFKHPSDWARQIEEELYEEIKSNDEFLLSDDCQVFLLNIKKHKYEYAGDAKISLDKKKIVLSGKINGEFIEKEFNSQEYISLPFTPNKHFEIQDGGISYRIKLNNPIMTTKWVWALKSLYMIKHQKKCKIRQNSV